MDHNSRARDGALEDHTRRVEPRLRWWQGISALFMVLTLVSIPRPSGAVEDLRPRVRFSSPQADSLLGASVALSAAGSVALIGAPGTAEHRGAVYVLLRSGDQWVVQTNLLVANLRNND